MREHYPPLLVDATADDILAVLRDIYRQPRPLNPDANPSFILSHESTIAEWRDQYEIFPWAELAEGMNADWSVTIPKEAWREVLEPAKSRRLRGVCELLARHVKLPRVRPAIVLGATCLSAGAFLTVRSYLAEAGAATNDLGPLTPLDEYTRRYWRVFLGPVSRLAPGALPPVTIRSPLYLAFTIGMLLAWPVLMIGLCAGWPALKWLSGLLFAVCYLGAWMQGRYMLPASVEFHGLRTFRDLSKAIAAHSYQTPRVGPST